MKRKHFLVMSLLFVGGATILTSCSKSNENNMTSSIQDSIVVQNVLDAKPLVESGTFANTGAHAVFLPGESFSFKFSAGKGQALSFATMYGWSNDLFFAPTNPGIQLYANDGTPIQGDVSSQMQLWDNGTRMNQQPGANVIHPGTALSTPQNIMAINGTDAQGNTYPSASSMINVQLHYDGNSIFTVTITNASGNTSNPTPFSPGVWAVSYIAGGNLLDSNPLYKSGALAVNGITNIAEAGDTSVLASYTRGRTGIFTPLSPILVVIYNGISNPIYTVGQTDPGHGLTKLSQTGDASDLAKYLQTVAGIKKVYVLPANGSTILLPMMNGNAGSSVSQSLNIAPGDKIAIATMYGFSNDWFFATKGEIDATKIGDISAQFGLFDDGTAVNQLPGAGFNQANLGGTNIPTSQPITEVVNPNGFNTLPAINQIIKATLK